MFLSKYGVARHFYIPIVKRGVVDLAVSADWTPAAGDVKISKDGGAAANVTNLPTAITMGNTAMWDFSVTATEMQAAQICITVADSATKAVEDTQFDCETYGNASAQHPVDFADSVRAGLTALPNVASGSSGGLIVQGTGTTGLDVSSGKVDVGKVNAVSTSSVTTINANQGTTQPINFTGTGASALAKSDMVDVAGAAVSTSTAQLGVNVVNFGGSAGTFASGRPEVNATHIAGTIYGSSTLFTLASHDPGTTIGTSTLTQSQVTGGAYALSTDANGRIRIVDGTATGELDTSSGLVTLAATQAFNNTGTWTGNIVGTLSTLTTYTGNTPQTGDSFARIGANGISLSAIPDLAGVTTLLSRLSSARAGYLDNLSAGAVAQASALVTAQADLDDIQKRIPDIELEGTASAGSFSTITLPGGASSTNDYYVGMKLLITGGAGSGQTSYCRDYVGATKVLDFHPDFLTAVDGTSTFRILRTAAVPARVDWFDTVAPSFASPSGFLQVDMESLDGSQTAASNARVAFAADRLDAAISSLPTRAQITGGAYALDTDSNGRIRIVDGTGTAELDTNAGKVLLAATQAFNNTGSWTGDITGNLSGSVGSIGTGGIAAASIAVAAAEKLADITLRRSRANIEASSFGDSLALGSLYGMIQIPLNSNTTAHAGKLTVFKANGVTELGQITLTTSPSAEPIVSAAL